MIPPLIKRAIDKHALEGRPCGHFVTAVLENDLTEAVARADENSLAALYEIVIYCCNYIPSNCWGSKEKVKAWIEQGGEEGRPPEGAALEVGDGRDPDGPNDPDFPDMMNEGDR